MNRFVTGDEAVASFSFLPNDGMGIRSKTLRLQNQRTILDKEKAVCIINFKAVIFF